MYVANTGLEVHAVAYKAWVCVRQDKTSRNFGLPITDSQQTNF